MSLDVVPERFSGITSKGIQPGFFGGWCVMSTIDRQIDRVRESTNQRPGLLPNVQSDCLNGDVLGTTLHVARHDGPE